MQCVTARLLSGQDLKQEIKKITQENNIKAGIILSAVGSLTKANLRLAGAKETKDWEEDLEIVSITGTIAANGLHIHLSIADKNGYVYGGHLQQGCVVNTTIELVIGIINNQTFERKIDTETGWKELVIESIL